MHDHLDTHLDVALASEDFNAPSQAEWDDAPQQATRDCDQCGDEQVEHLGVLGTTCHFRCRACGWQQSEVAW